MINLIKPFKNFTRFLLFNLIAGVICTFIFVNDWDKDPTRFILGTFWSMVVFITQWLGHAFIQGQIQKKYEWLEKPVQRLIWTLLSVPVYSVFAYLIVDIALNYTFFGVVPDYVYAISLDRWGLPIFISFFVSLLAAAYGFFLSLKNSIVEKETLKREMLMYKYEALRNQINPHFMFNSLNVLSDLVYEDQKMAVKFIHEFSDIYRYVLDSRERELVPLSEEIEFIEKFIFLLKTRFEDKLNIDLNIKTETDDLIVPLSIQLLIENAVKHNEISTAHPLLIKLERIGNIIEVTNPIRLKNSSEDSKKIGLKNMMQQFSYFTDQIPKISTENDIFSVKIPILKQSEA